MSAFAEVAPDVRFPDDFHLADYWLYDRVAEGRGAHVALRQGDRAWTYAEVAERSLALARALGDAGLAPGEVTTLKRLLGKLEEAAAQLYGGEAL